MREAEEPSYVNPSQALLWHEWLYRNAWGSGPCPIPGTPAQPDPGWLLAQATAVLEQRVNTRAAPTTALNTVEHQY